jgi:hypothetical protein
MLVAGIDVSTRAVDIIKLPLDGDNARWDRYELEGPTALERATCLPEILPRGTYWDDVALVALERPYGPGRDILFHLHLVVGAVIAALPARLRPPWLMHPTEWRKACGMPGNAHKDAVRAWATVKRTRHTIEKSELWSRAYYEEPRMWPQDACDAYCIAYAARALNEKGQAA